MECCLYPAKYTFSFNFSNYGIQSDLRKVPNLSAIVHQDIWRPCQKDALAAGHVRDSEIRQSVSQSHIFIVRTNVRRFRRRKKGGQEAFSHLAWQLQRFFREFTQWSPANGEQFQLSLGQRDDCFSYEQAWKQQWCLFVLACKVQPAHVLGPQM